MGTVATFDRASQTFEVHTPSDDSAKQWVVNTGPDAEHCVVFARMLIDGVDEGVHPFLCKIRENNGNTRRGVNLTDTGHTAACGGVATSTMTFNRVRIPIENLLDSISKVCLLPLLHITAPVC